MMVAGHDEGILRYHFEPLRFGSVHPRLGDLSDVI
jgi:hypothetical protein